MVPASNTDVLQDVLHGVIQEPVTPPSDGSVTPPPIVTSDADSCTTPPGVLPVLQEGCNTPVIPVISSNMAGLQQSDPESNTEGTVSKTYRLPTSVIQSMDRVIHELNSVVQPGLPLITMHSYGVDVLTHHEELRQSAQTIAYWENRYESAFQKNGQLTAQLQQAARDAAANGGEPTPAPATPTPPKDPAEAPANEVWYQRYQDVAAELKKSQQAHEQDKSVMKSLSQVMDVLPDVLEQLFIEASRNSWNKPDYYSDYFEQLLTPHLK